MVRMRQFYFSTFWPDALARSVMFSEGELINALRADDVTEFLSFPLLSLTFRRRSTRPDDMLKRRDSQPGLRTALEMPSLPIGRPDTT